mgnify:CR=1 FL=1
MRGAFERERPRVICSPHPLPTENLGKRAAFLGGMITAGEASGTVEAQTRTLRLATEELAAGSRGWTAEDMLR